MGQQQPAQGRFNKLLGYGARASNLWQWTRLSGLMKVGIGAREMSSFFDMIARARELFERNRRISIGALAREFAIDGEELAAVVVELTQVQEVASRNPRHRRYH